MSNNTPKHIKPTEKQTRSAPPSRSRQSVPPSRGGQSVPPRARAPRGQGGFAAHHAPGLVIACILLVLAILLLATLIRSKMCTTGILIGVCALFVIGIGLITLLVWELRSARFILGAVLAVIIAALMIYGNTAISRVLNTLTSITSTSVQVSNISFYVNAEDSAQSLQDASGYTFGLLADLNRENADQAIEQVNEELGVSVTTAEYSGLTQLIDALLANEIGVMVLDSAYLDILDDATGYEDISSQIRELTTKQIETEVVIEDTDESAGTDGVFTVYISGIDTRTSTMVSSSRSDVNIIATVNTNTHQVFLLSTPRDYYVPLSISNGVRDKLTHAGLYGVNVCIETLEMLYDIDIDYYFRVNFTGFEDIIDALGGITVYSEYTFTTANVAGYSFTAGYNTMNGEEALAFARERYNFTTGDRQRGKNQMAVIKAVIEKALSPEILKNYASILAAVEGNFKTSVPYDLIASLVREQLASWPDWEVVTYSVDGTGESQIPYSLSSASYVMVPDETTVETAKELLQQILNNEIISEP